MITSEKATKDESIGTLSFASFKNFGLDQIIEIFGSAHFGPSGEHTQYDWVFKLNGKVISIYNYDDTWKIGVKEEEDVELLKKYICQVNPKYENMNIIEYSGFLKI